MPGIAVGPKPGVVLEQVVVEEARRPGVGDHDLGRDRPHQPGDRLELADALELVDPGPVVVGVLVADRVPAGARHLHRHQVDGPPGHHDRATYLGQRDPCVVAVQDGASADVEQDRRVVGHRADLGDHGHPVAAVTERVALPGVQHDDVLPAGLAQPPLEDGRGIARYDDRDPRVEPGQELEVEVVEVLVGDADDVDVLEQRPPQVAVVREREPGPQEAAALGDPRVGQDPYSGRVDPQTRMTQRCDERAPRHTPIVAAARPPRIAQEDERGYAVRGRDLTPRSTS